MRKRRLRKAPLGTFERIDLREDDVLFFLHIPKTAGLSLISLLDAQFTEEEILELHSAPSPNAFNRYTNNQIAKIKLVRGHYLFGPYDQRIYERIVQNPLIITILRDPVERTISAYRHLLRHPWELPELEEKGMSLNDFVRHPGFYPRVVNRQTRMVVGAFPGVPRSYDDTQAMSDESLLQIAKEHVEQFAFVGVTERFVDSVHLIHKIFGWPEIKDVPLVNVSPTPSGRDTVPPEAIQAIEERTYLDAELHRFAASRLETKLKSVAHE